VRELILKVSAFFHRHMREGFDYIGRSSGTGDAIPGSRREWFMEPHPGQSAAAEACRSRRDVGQVRFCAPPMPLT